MRKFIVQCAVVGSLCLMLGCSLTSTLHRRQSVAHLSQLTRVERERQQGNSQSQVVELKRDSSTFYLAPVEEVDGERVMSLQIEQVTVVARVRSLPERLGKVLLDFVVQIPKELLRRSRSVVITPYLHKFGKAYPLEALTLRGALFDKLQSRDYWQYETYMGRFTPDSTKAEQMFNRFVKFPYPEDVRLDSLVEHRAHISYYYSQEVPTDESSKRMLITLQGVVTGVDGSRYRMPPSDTLTYVVSSMLAFVDTLPRYRVKVIDRFVTVNDRNYIQFRLNDSRVLDTLGDNARQLEKIVALMQQVVEQEEFYVDSITLTASSSPEGCYSRNEQLARQRAYALKGFLSERLGTKADKLITPKWIAEDWPELKRVLREKTEIDNREEILSIIESEQDPDRREQEIRKQYPKEYAYIQSQIYPLLRAVNFRYNLRRRGMIQDTIHTTELDTTYARGVELLQQRNYAQALYILNDYNDLNTIVAHLSLGHDEQALQLLPKQRKSAVVEYLKAIACSRLGHKEQGRNHFIRACELDARMEYRANLDPEITELLKE